VAAGRGEGLAAADQPRPEGLAAIDALAQPVFAMSPTATISSRGDAREEHRLRTPLHRGRDAFRGEGELLGGRPKRRIEFEMDVGIDQSRNQETPCRVAPIDSLEARLCGRTDGFDFSVSDPHRGR
jgi:hypothetical protein